MLPRLNHPRAWRAVLEACRDHRELKKLCETYRHYFSGDDLKWISRAGPDGWPRIFRLLRQEIRAWRGLPYHMKPKSGDLANAAVRRVWRPWRVHTSQGAGR